MSTKKEDQEKVTVQDAATLELDEFQKVIVELILETPAPGKHCARNAIHHLRKAKELGGVDNDMAFFRCITAEEEAASAIFHSLKRKGYKHSDKLKPRDHVQKNAAFAFLIPVTQRIEKFATTAQITFGCQVSKEPSRNRKFRVYVKKLNEPSETVWMLPSPLEITISEQPQGFLYDFTSDVEAFAKERNAKTIEELLRKRANLRNDLLYAAEAGFHIVEGNPGKQLEKSLYRVFGLLFVYLLIDQNHVQSGAQQTLYSFLKVLKKLPPEDIFY